MSPSKTHIHGWRRWMFGGYVLVMVVLVAVWGFSIAGPIKILIEQRLKEGLAAVANATAVALQTSDMPPDEIMERIADSDDLRLTLIAPDGTVLAESDDNTSEMHNHADRPEVVAALNGETGFDRRVSETDGKEYFYVTVPCDLEGQTVVVRVSRTMEQINALLDTYFWTSLGLLFVALTVAIAAAFYSSRRAGEPVRHLESVRTDFVANASHELKTPVAGIRLLSDSIGHAASDGDMPMVETLCTRLDSESARLQRLVTDLMDLSRLEDTTRADAASVGCDLGAAVATSVEAHRARANDLGLELTLTDKMAPSQHVASISAANATLICDNLLNNALTYTDRGKVAVSLANDDEYAILTIRDTGIGIEYAEQERVFERFYRVDTARSRESGGTGLGLSLVRHAVERANGSVELTSEPGQGSTFTVRLPLA